MRSPLRRTPLLALAALLAACAVPSREQLDDAADDAGGAQPELTPAPADPPVSWAQPSAADRRRGLEELRAARASERRGDTRGALAAYDRARAALPAFADWSGVLAAGAAAGAGDTAEVRRRLAAVGAGPAREWGWRVEVDALRRAGGPRAAMAAAERAAAALPAGPGRAAASLAAGRLHAEAGDPAGARPLLMQAVADAPEGADALAAARLALALALPLSPDERLRVGRVLLRNGGTDRGVAEVRAGLDGARVTPAERAAAQREAGDALFAARRYAEARRFLEPAAALLPAAGVTAGRAALRQGRPDEARALLAAVAARTPRSPEAAEAWLLLGDAARDAGQAAAAREHYRQAMAAGPHPAAGEAAARISLLAAAAGNLPSALPALDAYLATRPRGEPAAPALYWAGRAQLAAGRRDAADALFRQALAEGPVTFYGARAAERLSAALPIAAGTVVPPARPGSTAEVEGAFWRLDLLRELERDDEAAWELARLRHAVGADPAALLLVAEGMGPRGQPIAGSLLGRQVQKQLGAWDRRLLRIAHPFPHRELVFREARRRGLDPYIVAGLIRQESYFSPNALSPAGAVGLMQVMPSTAAGIARRAGVPGFRAGMLRDPEVNVRIGTLFLADQWRRWGGRQSDVYAAYNAGPGRVVRWRRFPEHADDDLYVERIPFAETRDYVKRVRTYAQVYRVLYPEP